MSKKNKKVVQDIRSCQDKNLAAMNEYKSGETTTPKSFFDLKRVQPMNHPQKQMTKSYFNGYNIFADGSAGTGKTYYAMYLALRDILDKNTKQDKIVIVRSAVSSRDIGFLPGSELEKLEPYERPYKDIIEDLTNGKKTCYDKMKEKGEIQFMPTSFVRGLTWDNAVVIVDEIQNMNFHEINSIMTRMGQNTRIICAGDLVQTDLYKSKNDSTGISTFVRVVKSMPNFDVVNFTQNDIIRSDFVKSWICALEDDQEAVTKLA